MHNSIINPLRRHRRLLTPTEDPHSFILHIDNSTFELETTCSRQAEYSSIYGRSSPQNSALTYGSAMHAALEDDLHGKTFEECLASMQAIFNDNPVTSFDEWRTFDHCAEGFRQYKLQYKNAPLHPTMLPDNSLAIECRFDVPLCTIQVGSMLNYPASLLVEGSSDTTPSFYVETLHVHWTGRIDSIVERDGAIWVMDHKTTSMAGPSFWTDFRLSSQMMGYAWAGEQLLSQPIEGIIIDMIAGRKPTKTGIAHEFERQNFRYTKDQLDEWVINTKSIVSTIVTRLCSGFFPMQTKWCVGKYGTCKYHDVCMQPTSRKLDFLMMPMYVDNTWNPILPAQK